MRSKVCVYWTFYNSFKRDQPIRLDSPLNKRHVVFPLLDETVLCIVFCVRMSMCLCIVTRTKQLLCIINTGLEVRL